MSLFPCTVGESYCPAVYLGRVQSGVWDIFVTHRPLLRGIYSPLPHWSCLPTHRDLSPTVLYKMPRGWQSTIHDLLTFCILFPTLEAVSRLTLGLLGSGEPPDLVSPEDQVKNCMLAVMPDLFCSAGNPRSCYILNCWGWGVQRCMPLLSFLVGPRV